IFSQIVSSFVFSNCFNNLVSDIQEQININIEWKLTLSDVFMYAQILEAGQNMGYHMSLYFTTAWQNLVCYGVYYVTSSDYAWAATADFSTSPSLTFLRCYQSKKKIKYEQSFFQVIIITLFLLKITNKLKFFLIVSHQPIFCLTEVSSLYRMILHIKS
ncbi:hypothetical protein L9F63_024433, partial [Diploptera punctata]